VLANDVIEARQADALAERTLFGLAQDLLLRDEKTRLGEREIAIRKDLHKNVAEMRAMIKRDDIERFCEQLCGLADEVVTAAEEAKSLRETMTGIVPEACDAEIAQLSDELEKVREDSMRLHRQDAELRVEVVRLEEAWYEQMQMNNIYARWMGTHMDAVREKEMEDFESALACRKCGQERAGVALAQCRHPFCQACVDLGTAKSGQCPVCGQEYKQKHIRPFLYKP
jgi:hypothetical protein